MTKFASRIATGIAILGLAAPAFAATTSQPTNATGPAAQTTAAHHSKVHKHKKVAQAGEKKLREVVSQGGFTKIRRAAETPFNMVLEARA